MSTSRRAAVQAEFGFVRWGGKRRGAGRKPKGERAGVSHSKRPKLCPRFPVHVTVRLREGLPSLRRKEAYLVLKRAFAAGAARFGFRLVHYSVQTEHPHFLAESSDEQALSRGMLGLSVRIARGLNTLWRRRGQVFADRFHARILRTPREVRNALVYVLQNARKHGGWGKQLPDPFSSGPWFEGWKGRIAEVSITSSGFLNRARTWLLGVGWHRHGLIHIREVPATS